MSVFDKFIHKHSISCCLLEYFFLLLILNYCILNSSKKTNILKSVSFGDTKYLLWWQKYKLEKKKYIFFTSQSLKDRNRLQGPAWLNIGAKVIFFFLLYTYISEDFYDICASIRIGRESWCLPYAGFLFNRLR